MNNYKNSHRRSRYKPNGDKTFRKRNGNGHKNNSDFNSNLEFRRKNPGRNNQNASKLVDKYKDLAREALSHGDKILSENYLQHADHFVRILMAQENYKDNVNKNIEPKEIISEEKNPDISKN
tara:strand:- start:515 stop:880 length:366 start_codon:yes stop_codon:yes gene_type:complete